MDFKINRVALSTALVISGDKAFNDYFAVGAECTISRDHYNKLVFTLRRDPKAKRRPHAAKNDHYRWQIRRADQVGAGALRFGAVAPEAVYMNRDGEAIIILPLELPDVIETPNGVRRPRGSRRPKAIPMPHWDEVKLAVRMINNFISMAAGEFEVVVRPEGGIRLTRLDVAE